VQILIQTYLSIHHAKSAAHFARAAKAIINENSSSKSEIGTNVGASILSSVAYLEASINELFSEAEKDSNKWLLNVDERSKKLLKTLSTIESIDRASILEKYDIFLVAAGFEPIPKGDNVSQNVKSVISLRNNITHYKASWLDSGSKELMRKGSSYKGEYWQNLNKLIYGRDFGDKPHCWQQANYAEWALKSSIDFVDTVFKTLGSKSNVDNVKCELEM